MGLGFCGCRDMHSLGQVGRDIIPVIPSSIQHLPTLLVRRGIHDTIHRHLMFPLMRYAWTRSPHDGAAPVVFPCSAEVPDHASNDNT